jgi:hypothetical protein
LLDGVKVVGKQQRKSLENSGRPIDDDAFLWDGEGPDIASLLQDRARQLAGGGAAYLDLSTRVSERLLNDSVEEYGPLDLAAVKEALACLMPEELHPRLDNRPPKGRQRVADGVERYCVHLVTAKWRVDVCEEAGVAMPGRPLRVDVAELFLKVLRRICEQLGLPVALGTRGVGERLGSGESLEHFRSNWFERVGVVDRGTSA